MGAGVRGEGLVAAGGVDLLPWVVDGAPAFCAIRVEVREAWDEGNPGGLLDKNNIGGGELKKRGECGMTLSDVDGVDDEIIRH